MDIATRSNYAPKKSRKEKYSALRIVTRERLRATGGAADDMRQKLIQITRLGSERALSKCTGKNCHSNL